MPEWIWGISGIVVFLILIVCGVRIAFAALIGGLLSFLLVYNNWNTAGTAIGGLVFTEGTKYALTVIPLFIFMGYLAFHSGVGAGLYETARSWLGRLPGGLASATVLGCAFFGAISGSSTAAVAMFSKISMPEMDKAKYQPSLSIGSIAAAGTLANLIPPSTLMVVYGMLSEQSIGKLLIAGFIPGLISAIIYSLMITFRCIKNPQLGPRGPSTSFREKISSLRGIIIVFIVMVIIIGGLYTGVFTPTEAGACSAFVMLIFSLIVVRGLRWSMLRNALLETARISCMIFTIIIAIKIMTTALISSGALGIMVDFFVALPVSPYLLLLVAAVIYIILGAFVGVLGMMVMTVPFLVPVLAEVGFDPIWLGVIVIKFCEVGLITPPIGVNVFVTAQVIGRDVSECFRAITWFLLMDLCTIGLFVALPQLVLFLPSRM